MAIETERGSPSGKDQSWDRYWRGTGEVAAWAVGGVSHPAIDRFWEERFQRLPAYDSAAAMLDIGSGNGDVVERALAAFGDHPPNITSVDRSEAAVANIVKRFPEVRGVVCDAASIPLESGRFNIVTSQFGVEYAGPGAIDEAARLLAPNGNGIILMHCQGSILCRESAASLDAVSRLQQSRFIPLASEMFRAGFAAVKGEDRAPYDAAASQLQPAVHAIESVLAEHGEQVAGGSIASLYQDVARIHSRLPNYDPDEVLNWLARLEDEMDGYTGRLETMLDAAIGEAAFERVCSGLRANGLSLDVAEPLLSGPGGPPLAWALVVVSGD